MELFIDEFLAGIRNKRTQKGYGSDIRQFQQWADEQIGVGDRQLFATAVARWKDSLVSGGYAAATIARKLAVLRSYAEWAVSTERLDTDALRITALAGPRVVRTVPTLLTEDQIVRLLDAPNTKTRAGLRDFAAVALLLSSGLRIQELVDLDLADINLVAQRLVVMSGKGGKQRVAFFDAPTAEALRAYVARWELGAGPLFRNLTGTRITARWYEMQFKRWRTTVGSPTLTPHKLRHQFATTMLYKTSNIRAVQRLLGHASITTTQIYTQIGDDELERIYRTVRNDSPSALSEHLAPTSEQSTETTASIDQFSADFAAHSGESGHHRTSVGGLWSAGSLHRPARSA